VWCDISSRVSTTRPTTLRGVAALLDLSRERETMEDDCIDEDCIETAIAALHDLVQQAAVRPTGSSSTLPAR
jgi:hypothetical protein